MRAEPRRAAAPGGRFLLLWTIAGTAAALSCNTGGLVHPFTFVLLGAFQGALLYTTHRRTALEWGVLTAISGIGVGSVWIVLMAMAVSGLPVIPPFFALAFFGALFGLIVGCGQAFSLRHLSDAPAFWIPVSALCWSAAGACADALGMLFPDPHGMSLFQWARSVGLSEMDASRVVGAVTAVRWGLPTAFFTGVGVTWFLRNRRDTDFSKTGAPIGSRAGSG